MANARLLHTATVLDTGHVLVAGGYNASAEVYDPETGIWRGVGAAPNAYREASATRLLDGRVLVAGAGDWNPALSAALYDPVAETWQPTGALLQARRDHTATLLPTGKVLVVGGASASDDEEALATSELYDPQSGLWTSAGALGTARRHHTATLLPDGRVLVTGGTDSAGARLSSAEVFDVASGTWQAVGAMTLARVHHSATLLPDGQVLVAGGGGEAVNGGASAELFSPATGTWRTTASMASPRRHHSATLLPEGQVLVVGGYHDYTGIQTSAEAYDPALGGWQPAGHMAVGRYQHTAVLLENGHLLVAGGFSNGDQSSAERYAPAAPPTPASTRLLVQVQDGSGQPLPTAMLQALDATFPVDGSGRQLFEGLTVDQLWVRADAPGHAPAVAVVSLRQGALVRRGIRLLPLGAPHSLDAEQGGTVETPRVRVSIPPRGVVDARGNPVTGDVQVTIAPVDSATDPAALPGPTIGVREADGALVDLGDQLVAEVNLWAGGEPAQVAPGKSVRLELELPEAWANTYQAGDSLPAWWLDVSDFAWREQGAGSIQPSSSNPGRLSWVVEVQHFTAWSMAVPLNGLPSGPGGRCSSSSQCQSGLLCLSTGVCRAPGGEGASCASSSECQSTHFCTVSNSYPGSMLGVCRMKHGEGELCIGSSYCQSGLQCSSNSYGVCWAPRGPGQTCNRTYQCQSGLGLVCDSSGYCRPEGGLCTSSAQCPSGTYCNSQRICRIQGGEWAYCDSSLDCKSGLSCTAGFCRSSSTGGGSGGSGGTGGSSGGTGGTSGGGGTGGTSGGGGTGGTGGTSLSCSLLANSSDVPAGDTVTFTLNTYGFVPGGSSAYWNGTRNGVTDVTNQLLAAVSGSGVTMTIAYANASGLDGSYMRYAVIKDASGALLCQTNPVYVTFHPPGSCDPRNGSHGKMWVNDGAALTLYRFHNEWCSIGTVLPAQCWENGTYYYSQQLVSQSCSSVGSNGSCYDPDAWWSVSCNALIDCTYNCSGQCVRTKC